MTTTSLASRGCLEPAREDATGKPSSKSVAAKIKQAKNTIIDRTCKARRIRFLRNGNRFYPGITIPVTSRHYKTMENLTDELTRLLEKTVQLPGAVRTIYALDGRKISSLDLLADGQSYICACNRENVKKIDYNISSQPLSNLPPSNSKNKVVQKSHLTALPKKKAKGVVTAEAKKNVNDDNSEQKLNETDSLVRPRNITLIRHGKKPRKIMRLLLNNRNSSTFDEVISAIQNVMPLGTGEVRKVFALSGRRVKQLSDFFTQGEVFFVYGEESVNFLVDFRLRIEEINAVYKVCKNMPTFNVSSHKSKPKTRAKGKKQQKTGQTCAKANEGTKETHNDDFDAAKLPSIIRNHYSHGEIIGRGNFAVVVKINEVVTGEPYALKIIDKRKGKIDKSYLDTELRIMKKLDHPHIVSLVMNIDHRGTRYLILEYVGGGDLFDAMERESRFSENQSRLIIRQLASALEYLHSMNIVHRDIKPENLLLGLDSTHNVREVKLADFTLACEAIKPLHVQCGTPIYMAPEIISKAGYGVKVDIWAAGVVLFRMVSGTEPFNCESSTALQPLFDAIRVGEYEFPADVDISAGARDLIYHLLEYDPGIRFTSSEILTHSWIMYGSGKLILGRK